MGNFGRIRGRQDSRTARVKASGLYRIGRLSNLFLWPFLILVLLIVLLLVPRARPHIRERLGLGGGSVRKGAGTILFHLASLGEANAAMPLIRHLRNQGHSLLLTTTSESGRRALSTAFPDLPVSLLPFDLPGIWEPFWSSRGVYRVILFETEIWPMMLLSAYVRKIPVMVASGRLSPGGFRSMKRWRFVLRPVFEGLESVLAASPSDRDRYREMGVREEALVVAGNIKWDLALPLDSPEWTALMGSLSGWLDAFEASLPNEPVAEEMGENARSRGYVRIVLGSAHPDETLRIVESLLKHQDLASRIHLLIAPRHLNRLALFTTGALSPGNPRIQLRSEARMEGIKEERKTGAFPGLLVSILDTHGELRALYGLSDVAITGGTFDPVGGHSPVEAAAFGIPQIAGPHVEHVVSLVSRLEEGGGLYRAADEEELVLRLEWLLTHPQERKTAGSKARAIVAAEQGALARTIEHVERFLKEPSHDAFAGSSGGKDNS